MTKMLSRVFKSRFPKTVQFRRFCKPEIPKIEQLYKKFQNDPELKDVLKNQRKIVLKYDNQDKLKIVPVQDDKYKLSVSEKINYCVDGITSILTNVIMNFGMLFLTIYIILYVIKDICF